MKKVGRKKCHGGFLGFRFFFFLEIERKHNITNHLLNIHEFSTKARKVLKLLVKEQIRHTNDLLKEAQMTE